MLDGLCVCPLQEAQQSVFFSLVLRFLLAAAHICWAMQDAGDDGDEVHSCMCLAAAGFGRVFSTWKCPAVLGPLGSAGVDIDADVDADLCADVYIDVDVEVDVDLNLRVRVYVHVNLNADVDV